ncbi:hypothetical protein PLESTF_000928000 [Pleodorina starrii]|nr:hypothetical protein PLESTF_000928000 [Pleodorina starrii]
MGLDFDDGASGNRIASSSSDGASRLGSGYLAGRHKPELLASTEVGATAGSYAVTNQDATSYQSGDHIGIRTAPGEVPPASGQQGPEHGDDGSTIGSGSTDSDSCSECNSVLAHVRTLQETAFPEPPPPPPPPPPPSPPPPSPPPPSPPPPSPPPPPRPPRPPSPPPPSPTPPPPPTSPPPRRPRRPPPPSPRPPSPQPPPWRRPNRHFFDRATTSDEPPNAAATT